MGLYTQHNDQITASETERVKLKAAHAHDTRENDTNKTNRIVGSERPFGIPR